MQQQLSRRRRIAGLVLAGGLLLPAAGFAQLLPPIGGGGGSTSGLTGSGSAVTATVLGLTSSIASTGALGGPTDALQAAQSSGSIAGLLTGGIMRATTIGWPDQVASDASVGGLALGIAGVSLAANQVMSQALATAGGASGGSGLSGLTLNGVPVAVTGAANQVLGVPGGMLVINEQTGTPGGIVVNALHLILYGVADVAIAQSRAAIQ